ncbi:MAG TPA: RHS repeat-associated core domain-containing protein [Gemmataceae bacterium]|nr:RHS repeat-associated core domain-containing protein [Gemmataceae bacterium]
MFGNRVEKDVTVGVTTTTTKFAVDGWNPAKPTPVGNEYFDVWADLTAGGSLATRYLRGDTVDQLLGRVDDVSTVMTPYWHLTDHLGSVRDILDGDGDVVDSLRYDSFGNIDTGSELDDAYRGRYGWTGREIDVETGLQYNRARYYDSATGRWASQDPMGFDAGDSNLYRYVNNMPTISTDSSGLVGQHDIWSVPYKNPITELPKNEAPKGYKYIWATPEQAEGKTLMFTTGRPLPDRYDWQLVKADWNAPAGKKVIGLPSPADFALAQLASKQMQLNVIVSMPKGPALFVASIGEKDNEGRLTLVGPFYLKDPATQKYFKSLSENFLTDLKKYDTVAALSKDWSGKQKDLTLTNDQLEAIAMKSAANVVLSQFGLDSTKSKLLQTADDRIKAELSLRVKSFTFEKGNFKNIVAAADATIKLKDGLIRDAKFSGSYDISKKSLGLSVEIGITDRVTFGIGVEQLQLDQSHPFEKQMTNIFLKYYR